YHSADDLRGIGVCGRQLMDPSRQRARFDIGEFDQDNRMGASRAIRNECALRACLETSLRHTPSTLFSFLVLATILPLAVGGCGAGADEQARDDAAKARVAVAKGEDGAVEAIRILQSAAGNADLTDTVSAQTK